MKLGDVVNSSVTVFIFLIPVLYSITMVEIDEDPQMGFESEEDDDELSDGEVRISCISCVLFRQCSFTLQLLVMLHKSTSRYEIQKSTSA